MSQKEQQPKEEEDNHSVCSSEWSLDPCGDENAIQNESNSKIALLEVFGNIIWKYSPENWINFRPNCKWQRLHILKRR
jgi:hypothetical protein